MDQNELQKKIGEYYSRLPEKAQAEFGRMEWMNTLQSMSDSYKLTEMQKQTLGIETTLLLLGIVHPEEYEELMIKELAVERTVADAILNDVNEKIIKNFGDDFRTLYENTVRYEEEKVNKAEEVKTAVANTPVPMPPLPPKNVDVVASPVISNMAKPVEPPANIPVAKADTFTKAGIEMIEEDNKEEPRQDVTDSSIKAGESILGKSGIGVIEEVKVRPPVDPLIKTETQKDIINGIENPPIIPTSIIADKLGQVTTSNPSSSTPVKPADPYREAV